MKISEVAKLVGISVRTLHHYDEIDLLKPDKITESGYRLYSDKNLETLQQILFFKELDFPLKQIKEIIHCPSYNQVNALHLQRKMLLERKKRLEQMIVTIDKTIRHLKGEIVMSNKEKFAGFDFSKKNEYEAEARKRWGDEVVNKSRETLARKSQAEQQKMSDEMNAIFRKIATLLNQSPTAEEVQKCVKEWYDFLNMKTGHHYSLEAFKGLGQMYVLDERFTKNIDQFGDGLAQFMSEAMEVFVDEQLK